MTKFYDEFIRTTVAHNPDEIDAWASKIRSIQYGTGRNNTFSIGIIYNFAPVGSVRVCVGPHCLVYELPPHPELPNLPELPKPLDRFLIDDMYTFVGTQVELNLEKLARDYGICRWDINAVDLGTVAATLYSRSDLKGAGLKQLAGLVLDETVELSHDNFKRTLDKEMEVEIRQNLRKAMDAMLELEKESDFLSNLEKKIEYDCITTFVYFCLGEFLQASHFDSEHVFAVVN
ncbi:hypothetical protein ACJIZ3_014531 [Penstemon smallii]|uniref:Uncharacterized protein n=1 Tax=Penstemon smallii TaxID=265156 RepID=A0ABD3RK39_9LAMI